MNRLLIGIAVGLCLPVIAGYLFLISGAMPVATKGPPLPLERFIAKTALHAAMRGAETKTAPLNADVPNLLRGAKVYTVNCAVCHGLVNDHPSFTAEGLFPKPPQLFEPDQGVTDDPVGKIYWKIENGIRLTGMPGYRGHLTETEIWQVSQLLLNADKLPAEVRNEVLKK